ncbi:MAG: pyruvate carboxylase subunit B [Oscillospiraceae bacterium]|nr:pyruvate carboxylase subunit B [Clostridiaceae bacterium]MDD7615586.1 pyruvate carboxylase subunit B [Clostridiaceae bacterium]MDY3087802.1 pyruvate carboxylase subunit B [Oscillospiraceae bacterium]MDY5889829.1 pyruvate carboxylase subunit B [Oscillospiraceae bacterium]
MKKIKLTETVLRDAQQSLIATRMPFETFEPILSTMDKAGYYSLECWGGATFDSCLRYLNEDPWERLRKIRKACPNTKLQMLLRGQNLLGYKHYPNDVVRKFVAKSVENGIDIIRIFDALNDVRNIEVAVDQAIKSGAHASGTICYTLSPVHNTEAYIKLAKDMENMGVQSICIKDMAGIISPKEAFELVKALKENVKLPIVLHTHCTTGLGPMTLQKAAEAGVDVIDTAISCFSGGTSQPATETMNYILTQEGFDTGLDTNVLKQINDFFKPVKADALKSGLLNPVVLSTDTDALTYQVPGGMLSNLVAQLTAQKKMDKFEEVLAETPRVRADLGYPPLVTPMSQMVGVQATSNVLAGERYKNVSKEIRAYVKGEYGKAPGKIDPELIKKVLGDEKPIEGRYADTLGDGYEAAKAEIGDKAHSEEDVLSYIAFPTQAEAFFDKRDEKTRNTFTYSIEKID